MNARDREVAQLRREALELRATSRRLMDAGDRAGAVLAVERALLREDIADGLEAGEGAAPLRPGHKIGTLGTMEAAQVRSKGASVSASKTNKAHRTRFQALLHERNVSLPEWAATQKSLNVETAKSWVKRPGKGGRPIPRMWADRIAAEFAAPEMAESSSWPSGIRP